MNATLKRWLAKSTPADRKRLATLAKTSTGMLYELAAGRRHASSDLAARIEKGAARMDIQPWPTRMDLNETCRGCEYAKRCTG